MQSSWDRPRSFKKVPRLVTRVHNFRTRRGIIVTMSCIVRGYVFSSASKGERVRLKTDRLSALVRRTYPQES